MSDDGLDEFDSAAAYVRSISGKLDKDDLLYLYARYKQATVGPCDTPKPSFYQLQEKSKWQAWTDLADMDHDEASIQYINRLDQLEPEWRGKEAKDPTSGWTSVSVPEAEDDLDEAEKTIFDRVKEGDLAGVKRDLNTAFSEEKDDNGMTILHWAADRGHCEIAAAILDINKAVINIQDAEGQTALHYAAACGHVELVRLLLGSGADSNVLDEDGFPANSPDASHQVKVVFQEFDCAN